MASLEAGVAPRELILRDLGGRFSGWRARPERLEHGRSVCPRCAATGRIWIGCDRNGLFSILCSFGAKPHDDARIRFMVELAFAAATLSPVIFALAGVGARL